MPRFFPHSRISQVAELAIQKALMTTFIEWGLPKSIRIDNGKPMGDPQRKTIPALSLWLEAMGIRVIFNRPKRPTDNAKVERMQRTTKNWAEVEDCENIEQLSQRLKFMAQVHRDDYKIRRLQQQTRKIAYPELYRNSRRYCPLLFDEQRVYQRLSQWIFVRKVASSSQFHLYGQPYYVGKAYHDQFVSVTFQAETKQWKIEDAQGKLIKTINAKKLDRNSIWNLSICQRTKKKNSQT